MMLVLEGVILEMGGTTTTILDDQLEKVYL